MRRFLLLAIVAAAALVVSYAASAAPPSKGGGGNFNNYSLAETAGTTCPGSSACSNIAAEPAIRADAAGRFFASSENGLGGGTVAFRSTDNGLHYTTLASPNAGSQANDTGFAPGGGDTDLAVAPVKNANGFYNVYVSSLTLANVDVSTSSDNGASWSLNPIGALVPGDDREWIAADGASNVCVSYHDIATFNIDVNCSNDAGATFTQLGEAIDTNHTYAINANSTGNMAIDTSPTSPYQHTIYQTFSAVDNTSEQASCVTTGPCNYRDVFMAVSTDGGKTFTDHLVHSAAIGTSYGHQFVNVSVDQAGNVYSVYTDDHHVYYSFSTNQGQTWSGPFLITTTTGTQIFPWSTAGDAGKLDVVYYQTPYYDGVNTPDNYPNSASWTVGFAQNLKATTPSSAWSRQTASPTNHFGGVCESGVTCNGNRDLFDDFGIAASPTTGLASIVFSDDQFDPNGPNTSGCDASTNNSSSCDHTAIATQTSGSGIFVVSKKK